MITFLSDRGKFSGFKIPQESIEKWKQILIEEENIMIKIHDLRDKVYAHTDPNNKFISENSDIRMKHVRRIIDKIKIILQEIHALALETDMTQAYKPLYLKMSVHNIIQAVIDQRQLKRMEKIDEFIKKANESKD